MCLEKMPCNCYVTLKKTFNVRILQHWNLHNFYLHHYVTHERAQNNNILKLEGCLTVHLPHEIKWNANLMQQGNFIDVFLALTCFGYICPSSGALDIELQHTVFCTEFLDGWWFWEPLRRSCVRCGWCRAAPSAPYTWPMQRLSRPPPIQKLGAEKTQHLMLLMMDVCTRTCRAKNTSIKLPCCIKLTFRFISIF